MDEVSFVCYQWNNGFREYKPEHVNLLAQGVKKHYPGKHRFICVTDETKGFSQDVELFRLPDSARWVFDLKSPEGERFPSSYRRLWTFSRRAKKLGEYVFMLDIDAMIVGDLRPLVDLKHDFIGWRPRSVWGKSNRIGGGSWLLKTGTHTEIWENLNPETIKQAHDEGWKGSDQAILSKYLSSTCAVWGQNSGIYQKQDGSCTWTHPPSDARIVHFNGEPKYWNMDKQWVKQVISGYQTNICTAGI